MSMKVARKTLILETIKLHKAKAYHLGRRSSRIFRVSSWSFRVLGSRSFIAEIVSSRWSVHGGWKFVGAWNWVARSSVQNFMHFGESTSNFTNFCSLECQLRVFRWSRKCLDIFIFSKKNDLGLKIFWTLED